MQWDTGALPMCCSVSPYVDVCYPCSSPPRWASGSGRECKKVLPDDARQVGRRIRVYRRKLRAWFAGSVAGVDQDYADRVQVEYDDGDKEWVELGDQPSRWEDDAADESDR